MSTQVEDTVLGLVWDTSGHVTPLMDTGEPHTRSHCPLLPATHACTHCLPALLSHA